MELLKLLETQSQKKSVGTLTLNKNKRFREIFFEEEAVYLVGELYSGRIAVSDALLELVKSERLSDEEVQLIPGNSDLTSNTLPEILFQRGTVEEAEFTDLLTAQLLDEIVDLFFNNDLSFHFQEGRVPENLFDAESVVASTPVQIADVLNELRRRTKLIEKAKQLIPSDAEVFVATEMGMSYKQGRPGDLIVQQVFGLMDGFRNLKSIIKDSIFFEFDILTLITEALEHGHLKKTLHPELKGISTNSLTAEEAQEYLPYYKNAVKYGVDEIAARERLAAIYEKLQKVDDAVIQYNFIGDALFRMGKSSKAVRAYQRALSLKPGEPLITDKIWKIYIQAANDELEKERSEAAIPLLQAALRLRPDQSAALEPLLEALLAKERHKEINELLDFLRDEAKKSGECDAALRAFEIVTEALPKNGGLKRKMINLYLDFGRVDEARQAMTALVKAYESQGARAKARELREKLDRLGSEARRGPSKKKRQGKAAAPLVRPRRKGAIAIRSFFAFFVLFFFYQACSLVVWYNVKAKHKVALALGIDPPPERMAFRDKSYEARNQRFAADCKKFLDRFPGSLFLPEAQDFYHDARARASELRSRRAALKRRRLAEATRLLESEGNAAGALEIIDELETLQNDSPLKLALAKLRSRAQQTTAPTASELETQGDALVEEGRWKEAYQLFRKLLVLYPDSRPARRASLPIVIESVPPGATVFRAGSLLGEKKLGTTPFHTRMAPGASRALVLRREGHFDQQVEILEPERGEPGATRQPVLLDRRPVWEKTLTAPLAAPPTLEEGVLFFGTEDGKLFWFEPEGKVKGEWSAPQGEFQSIKFKPIIANRQAYVVWNNARAGQLAVPTRHGRVAPLRVTKEYSLPGLATTPLFFLPDRKTLALGTLGGGLSSWSADSSSGARGGWRIKLSQNATVLTQYRPKPDDAAVLVGTADGTLLLLGLHSDPGKPPERRWTNTVASNSISEVMPIGTQIAVRTEKKGELVLVDPESGEVQSTPTLFGNRGLAFLPQKQLLYALAENGDVAFLKPGGDQFTPTEGTQQPEAGHPVALLPLEHLLGVLYAASSERNDRPTRLLVFDTSNPARLSLVWATKASGTIRTAASNGDWVAVISGTNAEETETQLQLHPAR